MENRICFLFGHATTPYDALPAIEAAAERLYKEHKIRTFVVGNRGDFDGYAATAVKHLKKRYDDISLMLLLAYHPAERPVQLTDGFDGSYYPPLEGVPRQYAIIPTEYDTDSCRLCPFSGRNRGFGRIVSAGCCSFRQERVSRILVTGIVRMQCLIK